MNMSEEGRLTSEIDWKSEGDREYRARKLDEAWKFAKLIQDLNAEPVKKTVKEVLDEGDK